MRTKHFLGAAAVAAMVMGLSGRAEAAAIVYVTPTPVIVEVGDQFSVDIMIDADDPVGGFDIDVAIDPAILSWFSLSIVEADANQFANGSFFLSVVNASVINGNIVGDPIGANALANPFQALRATFSAAALGVSAINLPWVDLSDELGNSLLDRQVQGGVVCVVADKATFNPADCVVPVPEPGLLALLATGLATAAVRRRRAS